MEGFSISLLAWQTETSQEWALLTLMTGVCQFASYWFAIIINISISSFSSSNSGPEALSFAMATVVPSFMVDSWQLVLSSESKHCPPLLSTGSENLDARFKFFHFCYVGGFPSNFSSCFLLPCTYASYLGKRQFLCRLLYKSSLKKLFHRSRKTFHYRYKHFFFANQKIFVEVSPVSKQRGHFMVS